MIGMLNHSAAYSVCDLSDDGNIKRYCNIPGRATGADSNAPTGTAMGGDSNAPFGTMFAAANDTMEH